MRAKKARTEVRREQIAHAAMRLLATRGWQRVTLAAIARRVGVVTSALYRHFQNKDEVLDAVLDLVDQRFAANIGAALDRAGEPLSQLHAVLVRHVDLILSGVPIPRIILSEDVFTGSPRHRRRVHAIYQRYLGAIADIIRAGQERGAIRLELSPEALAMAWLGLVQSPAILWLLGENAFDLKQQCESAWAVFAAGIATATQPAPASF